MFGISYDATFKEMSQKLFNPILSVAGGRNKARKCECEHTQRRAPGTSLVVQWSRLCASTAGEYSAIPDQRIEKERGTPV